MANKNREAVHNTVKAVKSGKMTTKAAIEKIRFGMWNLNSYAARQVIQYTQSMSQNELARYGKSIVVNDDYTFFELTYVRLLWKFAEESKDSSVDPNTVETCGRCGGTGIYVGAGIVENGVFKGFTGTCFRCKGRGTCTRAANKLGEKGRGDYAARQIASDFVRESCTCQSAGDRTRAGYMDTFTTSEGCPVHDSNFESDDTDQDEREQI